jgi:bacteriochlorophyllide a dehydrogenase
MLSHREVKLGQAEAAARLTRAVVFEKPRELSLRDLALPKPDVGQVLVDVEWSGISTGTERLLWTGDMPPFPGMGYPLVPGYESVGRVIASGRSGLKPGQRVFVPGANCYGDVRGLFGGAASRVLVPHKRVMPLRDDAGAEAVLLALAATAYHALGRSAGRQPDLIVGHGVLGRLLARLAVLAGARPVVWEKNPTRRHGAVGYDVIAPEDDDRFDYAAIYDVSGDAGILRQLIGRLVKGGEIVLAGFYTDALSFAFPPAFSREPRIRIAAEWQPPDLLAVKELTASRRLSLADLITHEEMAANADAAYPVAFEDSDCLKMVLDWRGRQ